MRRRSDTRNSLHNLWTPDQKLPKALAFGERWKMRALDRLWRAERCPSHATRIFTSVSFLVPPSILPGIVNGVSLYYLTHCLFTNTRKIS